MTDFAESLKMANTVIVALCHLLAMIIIVVGVVRASKTYAYDVLRKLYSEDAFRQSRLELGHAFSLALGILIGASILKTAIAPTWNDIGQLAAIITIRIILNFFLVRDVRIDEQIAQRDQTSD